MVRKEARNGAYVTKVQPGKCLEIQKLLPSKSATKTKLKESSKCSPQTHPSSNPNIT